MFIDAKGKACPMPVIMAKKELEAGCDDLLVAVDNTTAVQNLTRLAAAKGLEVAVAGQDGLFEVRISGRAGAEAAMEKAGKGLEKAPACAAQGCGYAVFISKDHLGEGDGELGYNLLKMALYTLAQGDYPPASLLFMNSGVKLPAGEARDIIDSVNQLIEKGTEVLVCGACLNFYGLTEQLKVGEISNMYDILGRMQEATKVISL